MPRSASGDYPSTSAEEAFLRHETSADAKFINARTIGDLIVDMLAPSLTPGTPEHPEEWESLEHAFLQATTTELRAVMCAMNESPLDDDMIGEVFTRNDGVRALQVITKRMEAGTELCRRLRNARWGNPNFGGGEEAAKRARQEREECEQRGEFVPHPAYTNRIKKP